MKSVATMIFTLLFAHSLSAASITVEACAEFELIEASAPGVLNSVPEACVSVTLDVVPQGGLDLVTQADERQQTFAYGGCNSSAEDITYRAERRIRYSITSQALPGEERTRAKVDFSWLPQGFTSGSGEMSEFINAGISSGVCADFFGRFSVYAEASSGLDPSILTKPAGVTGLFFDPDNPGHGFNFIRHAGGLTIYYYGHTTDGQRLWLVSDLYTPRLFYFAPIELEMFEVTDGQFGSPVLPETPWGNLTVRLDDCDSGSASLDGTDGQLEINFVRLAGLENQSCH